jgi:hypothetical protein
LAKRNPPLIGCQNAGPATRATCIEPRRDAITQMEIGASKYGVYWRPPQALEIFARMRETQLELPLIDARP